MKKKGLFSLLSTILLLSSLSSFALKKIEVISPDKKLAINLEIGKNISFSVYFGKTVLLNPSRIALVVNNDTLGNNATIKNISSKKINEILTPLYGKFKTINNECNETTISFDGDYAIVFRAYNEGVAYRFVTAKNGNVIVGNEVAAFNLNGNYSALISETPKLTSWELPYTAHDNISTIADTNNIILPALFTNKSNNVRVLLAESDVRDYPGMFIRRTAKEITGYWAHYPAKTTPYGGAWGMSTSVDATENLIAKTSGSRSFPWRIVMVSNDDKNLLTNQLIYKLAAPQAITDVSWIKPGKCDWEWWHDAIIEDAGIPTGFKNRSTELYKHYIDFASDNKLEYTLIDAGWSNFYHLDTSAEHINIQELVNYGKQKNVGIIVWCNATSLVANLDYFLQTFEKWGLKGFKVDFFDRDDQIIYQQMEAIATTAAKYHLLVDFHGCPKPTGLSRTYPNVLNYEAVRGEECSKWDTTSNPTYHLQVASIRMMAGSLDYTPGCMRNKSKAAFRPIDPGLPETMGTRCHELSLFILFDQYLAVLSDSPSEYRKNKDVMDFLSVVPATFDDVKVLDAKLGEYAVLAKRKNNDWYVGATTNWNSRNITIDFSFLDKQKKYKAEIFRDGKDADTEATDYEHETININSKTKQTIRLASGGGAVIRIYQVK